MWERRPSRRDGPERRAPPPMPRLLPSVILSSWKMTTRWMAALWNLMIRR